LSKLLLSDDVKAIQKIIISIGHISVKESSSSHLDMALNLIFSLCRSKVIQMLLHPLLYDFLVMNQWFISEWMFSLLLLFSLHFQFFFSLKKLD